MPRKKYSRKTSRKRNRKTSRKRRNRKRKSSRCSCKKCVREYKRKKYSKKRRQRGSGNDSDDESEENPFKAQMRKLKSVKTKRRNSDDRLKKEWKKNQELKNRLFMDDRVKERLKSQLTPEEYAILVAKGTEKAGTEESSESDSPKGYYACKACGNPLYSMASKYESGCGWPAFDKNFEGAIIEQLDEDGERREIICSVCYSHMGHIFRGDEAHGSETGERNCVNSRGVKRYPNNISEKEAKRIREAARKRIAKIVNPDL